MHLKSEKSYKPDMHHFLLLVFLISEFVCQDIQFLKGEKGDRGSIGAKGEKGQKGDIGTTGEKGSIGFTYCFSKNQSNLELVLIQPG